MNDFFRYCAKYFLDILFLFIQPIVTIFQWVCGEPVDITTPYGNGRKTTTYKWFKKISVRYHK